MSSSKGSEMSMTTVQRTVDGLIDTALNRHHEWRENADGVAEAARMWSCAPAGARVLRYAAYLAAMDQEQSRRRLRQVNR